MIIIITGENEEKELSNALLSDIGMSIMNKRELSDKVNFDPNSFPYSLFNGDMIKNLTSTNAKDPAEEYRRKI